MSIAGSSSDIKTAFFRVQPRVDADGTEGSDVVAKQVENAGGDRTIHSVKTMMRFLGPQNMTEDDFCQLLSSHRLFFGAEDPKPGTAPDDNGYADESNYLARSMNNFYHQKPVRTDGTGGGGYIGQQFWSFMDDPDVQKTWKDGATLTFSSTLAGMANFSGAGSVAANVETLVYYTD